MKNTKNDKEGFNCTHEIECQCSHCEELLAQAEEEADYEEMIRNHTPGCCRNGRCYE